MGLFQRLLTFARVCVFAIVTGMAIFSAGAALAESSPEVAAPQGVVADRLIVQVNAVAYTQWQIESHWLVKEALRYAMDPASGALNGAQVVSGENWSSAVDSFVDEMMIFQEAKRIGSFMPTSQMVDEGCRLYRDGVARSDALAALARRLGMTDAAIRRAVSDVVRIDAFTQSQNRGNRGVTTWMGPLRDRALIRRFGAAATWREIQPVGGSR